MGRSEYKVYPSTKEAWKAMYHALEHAKKSIYWQVYIMVDDSVGSGFFKLLEKKAKEGVDVKLIIDYWGSFALSRKRVKELRDNGVDVRLFQERRHRFKGFWQRFSIRNHRKVLVVDEQKGFIGGVNIDKNMEHWLDIHVYVRGKIVRTLMRSFAKQYIVCGGEKTEVEHLLKRAYRVKHDEIDFIFDQPRRNHSHARQKYAEALMKARERVILFSPYYFPDKQFLRAMWQAKKRGVRVDLLIPFRTDLRFATYAAYTWFSLMRLYGVKIHILKKMMHGKGVIVDDEWAMIGSSNIDHPSFYHNYEANIRLKNKFVVKKLKRILDRWINDSHSLDDVKWHKRGMWQRVKEWFALKGYKYWFDIK